MRSMKAPRKTPRSQRGSRGVFPGTAGTAAAVLLLAAASALAAEEPAELLPKPQEVLGWSVSRDPVGYDKAALEAWQGDNAGLFSDYNFVAGADAVYAGPGEGVVKVSVFELASAAEASGLLWCLAGDAEVESIDAGQGAWVGEAKGAVWRGVFCALVSAEGAPEGTIGDFLRIIAARAGEDGRLPDMFRAIDTIGYVDGTARYLHTDRALEILHPIGGDNVLELTGQTEMIIGTFSIDYRTFQAFIIRYPTEAAAISAASSYALFLDNDPEVEAAWYKQWGRVIAGTWTGLAVPETTDSEYMLFETIKELMRQVRIFQLQK